MHSGTEVNLDAVVRDRSTDSGVRGGAALVRFTDAVLSDRADLAGARGELIDALGEAAMVDAAGVIGNFQRMVRIADSTGIPVDGFFDEANADVRDQLGLNSLPSARLGGG